MSQRYSPRDDKIYQPANQRYEYCRLERLLVYGLDYLLVVIDIAGYQSKVLKIRTMEEVEDVTDKERYGS